MSSKSAVPVGQLDMSRKCVICDTSVPIIVDSLHYQAWILDGNKRLHFPDLNSNQRCMLTSHTCAACWSRLRIKAVRNRNERAAAATVAAAKADAKASKPKTKAKNKPAKAKKPAKRTRKAA